MSTPLNLPYPVSANVYWRTTARGNKVTTYVSDEAKQYKRTVWLIARKMKLIEGDASIALALHPRMTKSGKAHKQVLDLDNAIKVTLDALIGIAYEDDKQVKHISARYGEPVQDGGLTVEIAAYNGGF